MAVFRVGPDDVDFLAKQLAPVFEAKDILRIPNFKAYAKILVNNTPFPPFTLETLPFQAGDPVAIDVLKQMSYQRFGRPREAVEAEIREKYQILQKSQQ
jgi:hypothetical protein